MRDNGRVREQSEVTVRRAPKLPVFLVLGGALGAIATLILTSLYPADKNVGFAATFGYFLLYGIPAGVVLGAAVGLVLDAVSRRRARTMVAEHEVIEGGEDAGDAPGDEVAPR